MVYRNVQRESQVYGCEMNSLDVLWTHPTVIMLFSTPSSPVFVGWNTPTVESRLSKTALLKISVCNVLYHILTNLSQLASTYLTSQERAHERCEHMQGSVGQVVSYVARAQALSCPQQPLLPLESFFFEKTVWYLEKTFKRSYFPLLSRRNT